MAIFDRSDIAIDLGTANTIMRNNLDNVLFCEATCIAIEETPYEKRVISLGNDAKKMIGRTPRGFSVINPLLNGAISDFDTTKIFMESLLKRARNGSFAPRVGISIPQNLTQVERHSLYEATMLAGAKEVYLIEDPFSASVGAGLDISKPQANMVIDVGGGLIEVSIISLGGLITSSFSKEAGDFVDYAIIEYCRHNKSIGISKDLAESIKKQINPFSENPTIQIGVKDLTNRMPTSYELNLNELKNILLEEFNKIKQIVLESIRKAPPQISADLIDEGAVLIGGMALIPGIKDYLQEELHMKINISPNPLLDISKGVCMIMQNYEQYQR